MALGRLRGKIALITGGAQGIGAAHAHIFAAEGAKVIVADLDASKAGIVAQEIEKQGGAAVPMRLDVTSEIDWVGAVNFAESHFGGLTTLINNAGIYFPRGLEEDIAGWDKTIAVNQTGVFLGMRASMPLLKKSGNASIVNICSLLGLMGSYKCTSYHASKGAVRIMSKATAIEYGRQNVRVNSVYPANIETPIIANMNPDERELTNEMIPMGRWGRPEDIANASLFLASDEAAYITGAELSVDGGFYPG